LGVCHRRFSSTVYPQRMQRLSYPGGTFYGGTRRLGSLQAHVRETAVARGFIRLWQFRTSGESGTPPADRGPQWRQPRLARLEAVLFLGREPLSSRKIAQLANLADGAEARTLIRRLRRLYDVAGSAFQVEEVAGGFQLLTRPALAPWLRRLVQTTGETRLSAPALETLAVVAYRQPILRAEIESIRGVQCDDILRQLLERDLLRIVGRSEDLGRPLLYGTTKRFLELFGLKSLDDLPRAAQFSGTQFSAIQQSPHDQTESSSVKESDDNPGTGRAHAIQSTDHTPEENSVTTRIRPATVREELIEEPLTALLEASRQAARPLSAADEDDDLEDDDDEEDDDDDEEDWDDDDDDEEEEDDDFVDEEWEEVDDEDEEDDEEDDDELEDDDEEDDDWDDDEDEDEVEDDDE
jgi:segregation and condensation protein B